MQSLEISATGVPLWEIEPVLGIIVLALCIAAVWPSTVKTEEGKPKPGFFERIQNVSGRFACLGLASTITAEVVTGKVLKHVSNLVMELPPVGDFVSICLPPVSNTVHVLPGGQTITSYRSVGLTIYNGFAGGLDATQR